MPVENFNGDTFVAFIDISGFKEMMKTEKRAVRALSRLNQSGYDLLREHRKVNGFFVSDCGILFVKDIRQSQTAQLMSLLKVIEGINKSLLHDDIMLTTSISYGPFSYHQRIEFQGIEKNPIYGNAYVAAFLDNETGKPKIQPGQCRIISASIDHIDLNTGLANNDNYLSRLINKGKHHYFYWMVEHHDEITRFTEEYNDAYKLKYQGMLEALKRNR